jgi:two-component system chemotaxis response regulator CheY
MSMNILIVDDSGVMRAMILKTLRMSGLPVGVVLQAANGQEGLAALRANTVDLLLVDINMPVMNGEEMIAAMQADPALRAVPTIVISTEGSQTRIERLKGQGVRFVHKPFSPEAIRDTVRQLIPQGGSDG